ncbi:MAG: HAD family hydrolase [Verrucomicrobiia bacterium]|jgi:phosphoglycolate phosphatase-like HAD superfamily hydrolase
MNELNSLRELKPQKEFFIGIDSDGCVFDTMELKHKECFTPMFIKHFRLQAASKYAREVWEFVNLYSKTRGINRFPALVRSLNLCRDRKEIQARGVKIMDTSALEEWIKRETKLGNPALKKEIENGNTALKPVLEWSIEVNKFIEEIVFGVPPFPYFRESLLKMVKYADVMVVSQTPTEALIREWQEHAIAKYARVIAGQELGTKSDHIRLAAVGKYDANKILMIGDAPGDFKAAKANNALFYPIIPGKEELSWKRFFSEGLDKFFTGDYAGQYESSLIEEFEASLPENPQWQI